MTQTLSNTYLDWIRAGLKQPGKTQSGLARHLNIAHPQITQLLNGNRHLKVDEIPKIATYLELDPPGICLGDLGQRTRVRGEAAILATLETIDGLTPDDVSFLMKNIKAALAANAESKRTDPRDQSEHETSRREAQPARK